MLLYLLLDPGQWTGTIQATDPAALRPALVLSADAENKVHARNLCMGATHDNFPLSAQKTVGLYPPAQVGKLGYAETYHTLGRGCYKGGELFITREEHMACPQVYSLP